jgi:serine/threonine protein phosphatase PrpC
MKAQVAATHVANFLNGGLRAVAAVPYSQTKGGREVNEDSYMAESRELASGSRITLIGVFDGHGNEQLSHWLSRHFADIFFKVFTIFQQTYGLPNCVEYVRKLFPSDESFRARARHLTALNCPEVVTQSLCATFAICEEQAMSLVHVDTAHGGSCATVAAITSAGFFIAQVGDCAAALLSTETSEESNLVLKTSEHRPSCRPDEIARVESLGGSVYKGNAVGMAFSSLNVTRSLGDLIWRANEDWRRDNTRDKISNQKAIDEGLTHFSKKKGCVGLTSDPEWYSCCLHGGTSRGEDVVHWAISTNAPREYMSLSNKRLWKGDKLSFVLILGSDGFWETTAFTAVKRKLESEDHVSVKDLVNVSSTIIGKMPHDDSTFVMMELDIDRVALAGKPLSQHRRQPIVTNSLGGSSDGDSPSASSVRRKGRRRSASGDQKNSAHLDYLFS